MAYTPFKMKGSPMQRNFGIGSPLHEGETSTWDKIKAGVSAVGSSLGQVNPVGYSLSDSISDKYKTKKKEYRDIAKEKKEGGKTIAKYASPAKHPHTIKTGAKRDESVSHGIYGHNTQDGMSVEQGGKDYGFLGAPRKKEETKKPTKKKEKRDKEAE